MTVLVNQDGLPLSVGPIAPGGQSDHVAVNDIIPLLPKSGCITADRGYDSKNLRKTLRKRGNCPIIPKRNQKKGVRRRTPRPILYKQRYLIERLFGWLDGFRRLVVRWEYKSKNYEAFFKLGCALINLRNLTG